MNTQSFNVVKSLVGESITQENLTFIDSYISEKLALFIPVGGSCGYAITPLHQHPSYMFLLAYDTQTQIVLENKTLQPMPNTLLSLSPSIQHHEVQNYFPPKYCAIFIQKEFFEKVFLEYETTLKIFYGDTVDVSTQLEKLINQFIQESYSTHTDTKEALVTLCTHEIVRCVVGYKHDTLSHHSDILAINSAITYINTHYDENINLEYLAKLSSLSKSYFVKLFVQEIGTTPMSYLKTIRLENAKKLLHSKELNITLVAQKCGFNSSSYFTKLFKKEFTKTPKEYKESISL